MVAAMNRRRSVCMRAATIAVLTCPSACATVPSPSPASVDLEEIYLLRSIREPSPADAQWCSAARAGFEPFAKDAERWFSFWSVQVRPGDGEVIDTKAERVATLRGCFGGTSEPARQTFYAEIELGSLELVGRGECVAVTTDFPEPGLFPVRCQLRLSAPAPYVGGLLTTNTIASRATFGSDSDPRGYTQASIATIRIWRARPATRR
jgi:hypothetical protein